MSISLKRWRTTTVSQAEDAYPVDAVQRKWDTAALNQVWVGDITYLRTWEGWLYLATVIDAHSRRVIGWAIADHMRTDLIQDALVMALALRGERPEQVIFQPNRGTHYASAQITAFAKAHSITRSMGVLVGWEQPAQKAQKTSSGMECGRTAFEAGQGMVRDSCSSLQG